MAEEMTVRHLYPPSEDLVRVKLIKNTKGYGWEVTASGKDADEALILLREVEGRVREEYGGTEA
jgi:hypothetical protein